jgi:hypothetical protein
VAAYNIAVDTGRDWFELESAKRAHWAAVYRQQGWRVVWDAAQGLLAHVRRVQPGFPAEEDRSADFADHLQLRSRFDRAAHGFPRR